tara:strand:- start:2167 stop:2559 length:393 start_codon:yes stop_codon:yes gene_type:complete
MYEYNCKVDRVVDGDTIDVTVDLGFGIFHKTRVRLAGIDTPECRTRDLEEKKYGLKAKDFLINAIQGATSTTLITTHGSGKFGRVLGDLFIDGVDINFLMVEMHLAVEYHGQSKEFIKELHIANREFVIW